MTIRVTTKTVIFARPFVVNEGHEHPPGIYTVETEEELLDTTPSASRRVSTVMWGYGAGGMMRFAAINPAALDAALARDAMRPWHETRGQPSE
jgi:hypothetical protein